MPDISYIAQPAVAAAVETVKAGGPTTAELQALITQQAAVINAHSATIQTQTASIAAFPQMLSDALATYNTALLASLSPQLAAKAPAADLATLTTRVGTAETAILSKAATSTVTTLAATVTQQATDIGNRIRKDQADATAFPLGVPAAPDMTKAVQKSELAGGIQRPYRIFQNVGATPVGAYLRGTQTAAIVDALGLGQVFVLATVRIKTLVAPTLATTISLFKNGGTTAIYTQSIVLTAIPAVGKLLDILSLSTSLPADISLPATITASSSSGSFEIIIDGILK